MSNNRIDITKSETFNYRSKLIYVTYSKYENDWQSLMHFHPFAEIFYVLGGKGRFTVENDSFDVKADDMIIVNPNVYHHEDSSGDDPLEYVVLGVDELCFSLNGEDNDFLYQSFEKDHFDIQYFIGQMLMESEMKQVGYEEICQKLLELLLLRAVRTMQLHLSNNPIQKHVKREIKVICQYIDQNYSDDLTLESLAEYMNMNKYYMAHEFKKNIGISPINYLIERRLKECESLLTTTSLSIAEISETVGFSSQSYFSQIFKKNMNMTPLQYRNLHQYKRDDNESIPVYQKRYLFK